MSRTPFFSVTVVCASLVSFASAQAPAANASPAAPSAPTAPTAPVNTVPAASPSAAEQPAAPPTVPLAPPPAAAEPAAPVAQSHETGEPEAAEAPEPEWPVLTFHARIMTGVEVEREHPEGGQAATEETETGLFLEQAVIEAEAQLSKRIDVELGYNLRNQTIRDAFINYRAHDAVQLRIGRYKRPFSRIELRSRGKLPFRERGLFNDLVLIGGNFAGRSLGGMIWGRPTETLRYFVSLSSPAEIGSDIEGLDLIGRVVYEPIPGVSIGVNALHKWSERFADGAELDVNALGADTRIEVGDFEVTLEVDAAENPNPPTAADAPDPERTPWALGVLAYAEYAFKLSKKWTLAPVVVLEWLDTDMEYERDERARAVLGLSWNYRKNALRIMPQVEITRPVGGADVRGQVASETYYVMVSADM